ncbi:CoA transferase [Paraburkholderia sp. 22B1P]|uniref:CaiB/BaiF CoA transferase family protein n=1 Tax=Paraburkholderia sp. 22B1P TaxID=3080498 RepID=UPI00308DA6A7|nr:CoA transferase [Paraburkholderia sp. 22B1P]
MKALENIRVLDLGTFVAGPFCATILGEFGAEVIKIETPYGGDSLRKFGSDTECGDTLVWLSEARNKKCITLNLKDVRGQEMLRELVKKADVIVENFRPGVVEKWGLSYEDVKRLNPRAVFVRISAYGQNGPNKGKPGFARIAHAFSGLAYLSGEPDRPPVTPGSTSFADYASGLYGAVGALVALQARERTGEGQCVDLALYESIFRLLDEIAPAYKKFDFVRERMGADTVNVTPHSHYRTKDDRWIAIACSNDKMFARLSEAMGRPELASEDMYGVKEKRLAARMEVNRLVSEWAMTLTAEELIARCVDRDVPAGVLYSIADIFQDPQYAARENIKYVKSRAGRLAVPNVVPNLSSTPGVINWLGAALGEHNEEVYGSLLGVTKEECAELREAGII